MLPAKRAGESSVHVNGRSLGCPSNRFFVRPPLEGVVPLVLLDGWNIEHCRNTATAQFRGPYTRAPSTARKRLASCFTHSYHLLILIVFNHLPCGGLRSPTKSRAMRKTVHPTQRTRSLPILSNKPEILRSSNHHGRSHARAIRRRKAQQ